MPTKNPRLNIMLEERMANFLSVLAKHEYKSILNLAKELLIEALERREDMSLSALAETRDIGKAKKIKHSGVWK